MIKLFQIYYCKKQKNKLVDCFTPYLNKDKSIYVENQCIYDIRHNELTEDMSHIGVFSHSFHDKLLSKPTLKTISTCITSNTNVDIFSPKLQNYWWKPIRQARPLYFPNQCNIKRLAVPLLKDLAESGAIKQSSVELWKKTYSNIVYCNYWVAKKAIFIDYVDNFLDVVFNVVNSYNKDNPIFTIDPTYPNPPPEDWQKSTGFTSYPVITFIIERLINIYIQDRNLNHQAIL